MIPVNTVWFVVEVGLSWPTIRAAMTIKVTYFVHKLKIFIFKILECVNDHLQHFDDTHYYF